MTSHPYATETFANSLSHWGQAWRVDAWNCYVIKRPIADEAFDAAGVYPITPLEPNIDITAGLSQLRDAGFVSIVLVFDDFHRPDLVELKKHFDAVNDFKPHYVYRPDKGKLDYDSHHRRAVKTAYKHVRTDIIALSDGLDEWARLYDALTATLKLEGLHAFPHEHHQAIASMEGVIAVGAWLDKELVSCHVWVDDGQYMHSHLVASNEKGYEFRAAYAVNDTSIQYFANRKLLNFGGGAGNIVGSDDGLARFKKGFSNDVAGSYICGVILDKDKYQQLVDARALSQPTNFFPAYRAP